MSVRMCIAPGRAQLTQLVVFGSFGWRDLGVHAKGPFSTQAAAHFALAMFTCGQVVIALALKLAGSTLPGFLSSSRRGGGGGREAPARMSNAGAQVIFRCGALTLRAGR